MHKVVFTGSTEVGIRVAAGCAERLKPSTLELGGKSANIVFADSDLERAAATAPGAVFDNAGQDCCARSRILVERSVLDRFLELLEPAVAGVPGRATRAMRRPRWARSSRRAPRLGRILPRRLGPVAFRGSAPGGARILVRPDRAAAGLAPTASRTEEIFGPVVSVLPFDDEADAIASPTTRSTGSRGRSGRATSVARIRVSRGVESGTISVNSHSSVRYTTPFGGMKHPGSGASSGPDAALAFTETKNVFFSSN